MRSIIQDQDLIWGWYGMIYVCVFVLGHYGTIIWLRPTWWGLPGNVGTVLQPDFFFRFLVPLLVFGFGVLLWWSGWGTEEWGATSPHDMYKPVCVCVCVCAVCLTAVFHPADGRLRSVPHSGHHQQTHLHQNIPSRSFLFFYLPFIVFMLNMLVCGVPAIKTTEQCTLYDIFMN